MAVRKRPIHYGTAHLAEAGMMIGRLSAPLVMNLPLWFGSGQPGQACLSNMIHSPASIMPPHLIGLAIDKVSAWN
jgi:hypothetical protein